MAMIIEMFPAENGDAFLIRLDNGKNIVIDMGYATTYTNFIKDRFIDLNNKNQCIDLLIITHIDEDHIDGAIEFFKENGYVNKPNIIEVKEIWYNSYRHLQFEKGKVDGIDRFEKRQLEEIILSNLGENREGNNEFSNVSARQGSTLAGYLYEYGYSTDRWNTSFNKEAVNLDKLDKIILGDIKFYMLSPNSNKLKFLSKLWEKELMKIDKDFKISNEVIFDDAYEMYIKNSKQLVDVDEQSNVSSTSKEFKKIISDTIRQDNKDTSKSNGASISFILEYKDKKLLFLGDSHEDIILNSIKNLYKNDEIVEFDIIKISHHGSLKNNFEWIEKLYSKKYIVSTNGKSHGHPHKEVLAKILQNNFKQKEFYFNYPIRLKEELEKEELQEIYNYSVEFGDGKSILKIEVNNK